MINVITLWVRVYLVIFVLNIKYTSITLNHFLDQLWKVDANNVLTSKNTDWKPTDLSISAKNIIKNGTNTLDVINTEGTLLKIEAVAESTQEWKRSESDAKGFFTLTDKVTAKVLTAVAGTNLDHPTVAPNGLEIIGMCISETFMI